MRITIEVIPHAEQRLKNQGPGDWFWEGDDLVIRVSKMGDWRFEYLYARHEMDEAILCRHAGITTEEVDQHVAETNGEGDPDSLSGYPGASYQQQHNDALAAEWQMSRLLDVIWDEYALGVERAEKGIYG